MINRNQYIIKNFNKKSVDIKVVFPTWKHSRKHDISNDGFSFLTLCGITY